LDLFESQPFLLDAEIRQPVALRKHFFFNLLALGQLLFQKRVKFLLLKQLLRVHIDPILDRVDVNSLFVIFTFLFLLPPFLLLTNLLLQASELGHLLLNELISFLKVNLKFLNYFSLVFRRFLLL
jgi:hypothetical protein